MTRVHPPHEAPLELPSSNEQLQPHAFSTSTHTPRASCSRQTRWLNLLCRRSTGILPSCMCDALEAQAHGTDEMIAGGFCSPSRRSWYAIPVPVFFSSNDCTDPDWCPPSLRDDAPPISPQEARPAQDPPTAVAGPRSESAPERQCSLSRCFQRQEGIHGTGVPGGQVSGRA